MTIDTTAWALDAVHGLIRLGADPITSVMWVKADREKLTSAESVARGYYGRALMCEP